MNVLHKLSAYLYRRCGYVNRKGDHRGLSIIELVCAIAILTLVGAGVSGVMVVGANSYRNGTTEVELQTEAQMAVNLIGDLVIDTTATVTGTPDPAASSTINVEQSDRRYVVSHVGSQLLYSEYRLEADGAAIAVAEGQLLAENVTEFEADVSDFASSGSLRLYMKLEKGTKSYAAYYTITARNGRYTVTGGGVAAAATVVAPNEIVVEPNQDFVVNATVVGITNNAVTWTVANNSDGNTQILVNELGEYYLHVGMNETSNNMILTASTVAMDGASPLAFATVNVRLRRVNDIDLNGSLTSGEALKPGATYRVTPTFVGTTLERLLGSESDMDYVSPYDLTWSYELRDENGSVITNASAYFDWSVDTAQNCAYVTLKQDFETLELTVYARAMHPEGANKTGLTYATGVMGEWSLSNGLRIVVSGGWARGGNSGLLLENIPDDNINWDYETDWSTGESWRTGKNHNVVNFKWWIWKYWWEGRTGGEWVGPYEQGNNGAWSDHQGTNAGFAVVFEEGDSLAVKEYLNYRHYSYSAPYFVNDMDMGIDQLKLQITFHGTKYDQVGTAVFDVPEVAFQFRNSAPSDAEGAWSSDTGAIVIYVTPEDRIDTYATYFKLVNGWADTTTHPDFLDPSDPDYIAGEDDDYIAYNRFVGVITDADGYANDRGHDLNFVNDAGTIFTRPTNRYSAMNIDKISYGSGPNCLIAVKISQDEKNTLCAGSGTVIKEIYEYNYLFNTQELVWAYDAYADWGRTTWDMYNSVKGCDGYLEYHFVQPNVQITNHTDNKPLVMYCPTGADAGLVNGIYYINENTRYQVAGTTANYQVNSGSGFATQYTLTWNGSMWCD